MPGITARISSAFSQKDEGKIDRSNMDVRTDRVYVSVPSKKIVEGATIDVSPGEFVGLIGPNGSGKSTLLKSIYRVMKKDSGEIDLGGESIDSMSYRDSAMRMAVVTQHNYFNFEFKVEDVVFMGRTPHKGPMEMDSSEDRRIVEEALDRVNMLEMKDRAFATLSGGEQQRIMLARALAQDTPILILDEPTNHLDIKYQLEVLDIEHGTEDKLVTCFNWSTGKQMIRRNTVYTTPGGRRYIRKAGDRYYLDEMMKTF